MTALYALFFSFSLLAVNNTFSAFRSCQIHIPSSKAHKATTRVTPQSAQNQKVKNDTLILLRKAKIMLSRNSSQNKLHEIISVLNQADKKNPLVQRLKGQIHAKMR